jgi:glycosyltransferase involved in cell wall biosynthesis
MRTFHPVWNPEMAVRVLALLRKDFPEATLTMAGDDTQGLRRGVEQLADSLRLGDAVRFVGFLDMEGKAREGQEADIFLNTNRIDNMPVAVVEACAMGLPVVSTNVGGVPYLLRDGETALLVPSEDDAAMAAAVKRLLNEPGLAQRLSENGRRLAEESSWSRVLPLWESQFRDLMSRTRPR